MDFRFGDHDEHRKIDRVDAFAEDGALTSALAANGGRRAIADQEAASVLKVVTRYDPRQRLTRRKRLAITCVDIADFALGDRHESRFVKAILPAPIAEMHATAQKLRLIACFTAQGDDSSFGNRAA